MGSIPVFGSKKKWYDELKFMPEHYEKIRPRNPSQEPFEAEDETIISGAVSPEEKERMALLMDFEKNLSPEIREQIMNKVQDIGTDDIAYSSLFTGNSFIDRNPTPSHGGDRLAEELFEIDPKIGEMTGAEFFKQRYALIDQYLFPRQLNRGLKKMNAVFEQGIVGTSKEFNFEQMMGNLAIACGTSVDEIDALWKQGGKEKVTEFAWSKGISKNKLDKRMEDLEANKVKISAIEHKKLLKEKRTAGEHALIHFNITGRAPRWLDWKESSYRPPEESDFLEISSTAWTHRHDNVAVIFDISDLEETDPGPKGRFDLGRDELFPKTFTSASVVDTPGSKKIGSSKPRTEFGFITATRIPPRKFQGLVYSSIKRDYIEYFSQKTQSLQYNGKEYYTDTEILRIVRNIAATMVEANKDQLRLLMPIYDSKGNLLWPKKMSYEEVKKVVVERKKQSEK